jgi:predicted RNA-binding Zn-ribbon protein involved in translation (DUF1610 family)
MLIVLRGAIILRDDPLSMEWTGKCEKCGMVQNARNQGTDPGSGGTWKTSFRCSKCGNDQIVEIRHE